MARMTEADKVTRYGVVVGKFNSITQPDKIHHVRYKDGVYSCSCKGWIFNREKPKRCRHTDWCKREQVQCTLSTDPLMVECSRVLTDQLQRMRFTVKNQITIDKISAEIIKAIRPLVGSATPSTHPSDPNEFEFGGGRLITLDD